MKFVFYPSKLKKQPFFAIISLPPLPTPMVLNILFTFRIFKQLALALKKSCPEFTALNIFFLSFRIFEQLALALKT